MYSIWINPILHFIWNLQLLCLCSLCRITKLQPNCTNIMLTLWYELISTISLVHRISAQNISPHVANKKHIQYIHLLTEDESNYVCSEDHSNYKDSRFITITVEFVIWRTICIICKISKVLLSLLGLIKSIFMYKATKYRNIQQVYRIYMLL